MLTHINHEGQVHMVDVSPKEQSLRTARAQGFIALKAQTLELVRENKIKKGSVLTTASLAGIQAAKQCSQLIPLCHNIPLSQADVSFTWHPNGLEATAVVSCIGPTGVEMEALTAVSLALLTIYDMCKAVDKEMEITNIRLIEKTKTKTD
ncbi:MAG: cyclic pyranopterin monophosphate synthase MoaC [Bacteroidales bacterium]|jgi:cyclic pyranopterin phosphate synthase|nr:cyclic pyranopterin monophosphate synthase MoaC [Bacteroidales bacterium]NLK79588.1 cyclic pyranopterin monophosphate synthase MoaC [Bacteroidales bacterium]HPX79425.1 cyclic pyranopterin monophosphate synthase MoaC [Bacteroidales bacterium]HQB23008.1 cyclic pyranopterin monophosphate synthase MoaC [Bacteroidales bacterium]